MRVRSIRLQHRRRTAAATFLVFLFSALHPRLAAQTEPARATIEIDASRVAGPISPLLYGQFIEHMFEGVKLGLAAELLRNRSFEDEPGRIGLSRGWERYPDDRDDDYALNFIWDQSARYPEQSQEESGLIGHSLRVDVGDGAIKRHGIFQSAIPVRAGLEYRGSFWLKASDYKGRITVALESGVLSGPVYAQADIEAFDGNWRKYDFSLQSNQSDPLARFAILFEGRGRLWLDQVSLLPTDAVDGVRRDVFEKIKALKPAFIRWPGGNVAQDYHWRWGVGPRDARVAWINLSWKNEIEPSDFGTAEFIGLSHNVGAEPSITVNVEGRGATAAEAAAWVEYCNGPVTTKYGALRAAHGHPESYGVKFWEIGNEIWGSWVRGHSDAATYARNFNRYAAAMRQVDPTIKLIAVGDNDMNWNRTVLGAAGANIDYLAIHHYYGRREMAGDLRNLLARPLYYEQFYRLMSQLLRELSPQHRVRLAINEWGLDLPEEQQYSMLSALYGARLMNIFERTDGLVAMSAVSDLVNGWPGGIVQAGRHGLFVSPLYWVNQLYSNHTGTQRLLANVTGPTFDSTREGKAVPFLDVVASRSPDQQYIFIKAVNTDLERALATMISLKGVRVLDQAELAILNSPTLESANGFRTPEAIKPTISTVAAGSQFQLNLPPHSVSVLRLQVAH